MTKNKVLGTRPASITPALVSKIQKQKVRLKFDKSIGHGAGLKSVEISPQGDLAYAMDLEGASVWIIDVKTEKIIKRIDFIKTPGLGHNYTENIDFPSFTEAPVDCNFTEKGRYAWISFHNDSAIVRFDSWQKENQLCDQKRQYAQAFLVDLEANTKTRIYLPKITTERTPKVVAVTPDQKYIVTSNWFGNSISIIDPKKMKNLLNLKMPPGHYIPRGIAISSNSRLAYISNMGSGTISVFSFEKLKFIRHFPTTSNPSHLLISSDDKYLFVSDNREKVISKVEIISGRTVEKVKCSANVLRIEKTPDERYLLAAHWYAEKLSLIDLKNFKLISTISSASPIGLAISPDSKKIWTSVYGSWPNSVNIYQLQTD